VNGRQWAALGSIAALALVAGGWLVASAAVMGTQVRAPALAVTLAALRGNIPAHNDYLLNCAGCHGLDGAGVPRQGVPDFRRSAGVFTRTANAREYLIRVPGSSGSLLTNEALAGVLNWIVAEFGGDAVGPDFQPFTTGEVRSVRRHSYADPAVAREQVAQELRQRGLSVAPYYFGKHPGFGTQAAEGQ
jgi:hypothetical protein